GLSVVKWPIELQMLWTVTSVPIGELRTVEGLAEKYDFRLAKGLTPVVISDGPPQRFPIECLDNVYTIQGFLKDEERLARYALEVEAAVALYQAGGPPPF